MSTIQVRTDDKTKKAAQRILGELGLDLSSAINVYLVQIIKHRGIPFTITTENGLSPAYEAALLKDIAWARKHGKSYASAKEMFDDILKR